MGWVAKNAGLRFAVCCRRQGWSENKISQSVRHVVGRLHGAEIGAAVGKIVRAVAAGAVAHDEIKGGTKNAIAVIVAHVVAFDLTSTTRALGVNACSGGRASVETGGAA